jgi:hypothetical protein
MWLRRSSAESIHRGPPQINERTRANASRLKILDASTGGISKNIVAAKERKDHKELFFFAFSAIYCGCNFS